MIADLHTIVYIHRTPGQPNASSECTRNGHKRRSHPRRCCFKVRYTGRPYQLYTLAFVPCWWLQFLSSHLSQWGPRLITIEGRGRRAHDSPQAIWHKHVISVLHSHDMVLHLAFSATSLREKDTENQRSIAWRSPPLPAAPPMISPDGMRRGFALRLQISCVAK